MITLSGEESAHRVTPSTGLILVDGSGKPIYYNCEAMQVLTYPRQERRLENVASLLPRGIQSVLLRAHRGESSPSEFTSGRRRYVCRMFSLNPSAGTGTRSGMVTALLLERDSGRAASFSEVAEKFHLTVREQEVVGLLTFGLTGKEIADRMDISPNTVKTFFRLVMTKMGVCTRAGIVGKIASI
jgi:DNA-binding CsgD family transcriptional regulator